MICQGRILVADIQREVANLYALPVEVANLYALPVEVLREPDGMYGSRQPTVARPRQIAMYLSRQFCAQGAQRSRASLAGIGSKFGGRDHSTVLHGCRTIEKLITEDPEVRHAVGEIGLRLIEGAR
jgi:chromosomal replication initiator protein